MVCLLPSEILGLLGILGENSRNALRPLASTLFGAATMSNIELQPGQKIVRDTGGHIARSVRFERSRSHLHRDLRNVSARIDTSRVFPSVGDCRSRISGAG